MISIQQIFLIQNFVEVFSFVKKNKRKRKRKENKKKKVFLLIFICGSSFLDYVPQGRKKHLNSLISLEGFSLPALSHPVFTTLLSVSSFL